jgi:hypothetical protein
MKNIVIHPLKVEILELLELQFADFYPLEMCVFVYLAVIFNSIVDNLFLYLRGR